MSPQFFTSAKTTVLLATLGMSLVAAPAAAQFMQAQDVVTLRASHLNGTQLEANWWAFKFASYSTNALRNQLSDLQAATLAFETANGGDLPTSASQLFSGGFVDDPQLFYNPGDSDPPPQTIDNDILNAANSSQISFDYFGLGLPTLPPDAHLFRDNTSANNAGLARYYVRYDGITGLLPDSSHVFVPIHVAGGQNARTTITRPPDLQPSPYAFDLPTNAVLSTTASPVSYQFLSQASLSQSFLDVFAAEGFDEDNQVSALANGGVFFENARVLGPASPGVSVTTYSSFDTLLTVSPGTSLNVAFSFWSVSDSAGVHIEALALIDGSPKTGVFVAGVFADPKVSMIDHRTLAPGDDGYVPDALTISVRGVVQHSSDFAVDVAADFGFLTGGIAAFNFTEGVLPGQFGRVSMSVELPVSTANDQVKLFLPAGYTLDVPDTYGPGDMVVAALRGDFDANGAVDSVDRVAFEAEYTRPLSNANHVFAGLNALQAFDFDGDGDIDCRDYTAFKAAWTIGGSPAFLALCESDADGDGVADGDDACPSTPGGAVVVATGCPFGDSDADGSVDAVDAETFASCMAGPLFLPMPLTTLSATPCTIMFDADADFDIDLLDFAVVQRVIGTEAASFAGCLSGPFPAADARTTISVAHCLDTFDANADRYLDLFDYAALQRAVGSGGSFNPRWNSSSTSEPRANPYLHWIEESLAIIGPTDPR